MFVTLVCIAKVLFKSMYSYSEGIVIVIVFAKQNPGPNLYYNKHPFKNRISASFFLLRI